MKTTRILICILMLVGCLTGQTVHRINGNGSAGVSYVGPFSSLPTSCTIGEIAIVTDATPNIYISTQSPCVWTQQTIVVPQTKTAVSGQALLSYDAATGAFTQGALTAAQVGALPSTTILAATKAAVSGQPLLSYDSTTGAFTQGALTAANVGALPSSTVVPVTKTAVSGQPLLSYDSTTGAFTQGALTAANVGALPSTTVVPATKAAVSGQPLLSYDSSTGAFTQGALTAANVGAISSSAGSYVKATFSFGCPGTGGTTTWFIPLWGGATWTCASATTATGGMPIASAGTLKNLYCKSSAAAKNGTDGAVTVNYDASTGGTLTCTIGTGTSCSDVTHSQAVVAGHYVVVSVTGATSETLANLNCQMELWN